MQFLQLALFFLVITVISLANSCSEMIHDVVRTPAQRQEIAMKEQREEYARRNPNRPGAEHFNSSASIWTDPQTGCQYVGGWGMSAMTPRLDREGKQICIKN